MPKYVSRSDADVMYKQLELHGVSLYWDNVQGSDIVNVASSSSDEQVCITFIFISFTLQLLH